MWLWESAEVWPFNGKLNRTTHLCLSFITNKMPQRFYNMYKSRRFFYILWWWKQKGVVRFLPAALGLLPLLWSFESIKNRKAVPWRSFWKHSLLVKSRQNTSEGDDRRKRFCHDTHAEQKQRFMFSSETWQEKWHLWKCQGYFYLCQFAWLNNGRVMGLGALPLHLLLLWENPTCFPAALLW